MKRHTFLISSAGALVVASGLRAPVLASFAPSDPDSMRVAVRRHAAASGATPGGCATRARGSDTYTLAFALTGRR